MADEKPVTQLSPTSERCQFKRRRIVSDEEEESIPNVSSNNISTESVPVSKPASPLMIDPGEVDLDLLFESNTGPQSPCTVENSKDKEATTCNTTSGPASSPHTTSAPTETSPIVDVSSAGLIVGTSTASSSTAPMQENEGIDSKVEEEIRKNYLGSEPWWIKAYEDAELSNPTQYRSPGPWEGLHHMLTHFEKENLVKWSNQKRNHGFTNHVDSFHPNSRDDFEQLNKLVLDVGHDLHKLQASRVPHLQWKTVTSLLAATGHIRELHFILESLFDELQNIIQDKDGVAQLTKQQIWGLCQLPTLLPFLPLRRLQCLENFKLGSLVWLLKFLERKVPELKTAQQVFEWLDKDNDNILSRKDLMHLREYDLKNEPGWDRSKLVTVIGYLQNFTIRDFLQLVHYVGWWASCHTERHGDIFFQYMEPHIYNYIDQRKGETGPNLLTIKRFKEKGRIVPVDEFVNAIGSSHELYGILIPFIIQKMADSEKLVVPDQQDNVTLSVGMEGYLSTLKSQILAQFVENETLRPSCNGTWDIASKFIGGEKTFTYSLFLDQNGKRGWSDLTSTTPHVKTFRVKGEVPEIDKIKFRLLPINKNDGSSNRIYYVTAKFTDDFKKIQGKWGTDGFEDNKMVGEITGERKHSYQTSYTDHEGLLWDPRTDLILLLERVIARTKFLPQEAKDISKMLQQILSNKDSYAHDLSDLAFIFASPLLQTSLLRNLCAFERAWTDLDRLSLALVRLGAVASLKWSSTNPPPSFYEIFSINKELQILSLPENFPTKDFEKVFNEHTQANTNSLPEVAKQFLPHSPSNESRAGTFNSNFVCIVINILVTGHILKKEIKCVLPCLKVARNLPPSWITQHLTDSLINIALAKPLEFDPPLRYPVFDYLLSRSENDMWTHHAFLRFLKESIFSKSIREHCIWPRNKDALYLKKLAQEGILTDKICTAPPFHELYSKLVTQYDDVEEEPFMKKIFLESNLWDRFNTKKRKRSELTSSKEVKEKRWVR